MRHGGKGGSPEGLNIIPIDNPAALGSYYLAVFSVLPIVGLVTGVLAVIFGVRGIERSNAKDGSGGTVHSLFGLVVGGGAAGVQWAIASVVLVAVCHDSWFGYRELSRLEYKARTLGVDWAGVLPWYVSCSPYFLAGVLLFILTSCFCGAFWLGRLKKV
jgi:hypothetical protein